MTACACTSIGFLVHISLVSLKSYYEFHAVDFFYPRAFIMDQLYAASKCMILYLPAALVNSGTSTSVQHTTISSSVEFSYMFVEGGMINPLVVSISAKIESESERANTSLC